MPQMGVMAPGAPAAAAAPAAEEVKAEKEFFDVKLVSFDPASKIKVIKEVRAITGLGLKEVRERTGKRMHPMMPRGRAGTACLTRASMRVFAYTYSQAKDLVEGVPKDLKKEMSKADADAIVEKLKAVGGVVNLE